MWSYSECMFNFIRNCQIFPKVVAPLCILQLISMSFSCSTSSSSFDGGSLFNFSNSRRHVVCLNVALSFFQTDNKLFNHWLFTYLLLWCLFKSLAHLKEFNYLHVWGSTEKQRIIYKSTLFLSISKDRKILIFVWYCIIFNCKKLIDFRLLSIKSISFGYSSFRVKTNI